MDDDFINMNIPHKTNKASFDDIDTSMTSARHMGRPIQKMPPEDQDQEFNDHFAPMDPPFQEKSQYENNIPIASHQTTPIAEAKHFNHGFLLQQKQLLERELSQNQRNRTDSQRQMKIVMSEPKFLNQGFSMNPSVSNPSLLPPQGMGLKNEPGQMSNVNLNESQDGGESSKKQKGNVKNTYIKKINSLINLSRIEDTTAKHSERARPQPPSIGKKDESKEDKEKNSKASKGDSQFKRNRESARNSRQRKKMYIELLESKVSQLSSEIDETKQILEQNNENFNSICHNSKYLNSLVVGRQQLFEKLEKSFAQEKPDEYQISLLIDSFRLRLGASGRERVKSIDYFFEQIVENFLPTSLKYLLLSAAQQEAGNEPKTDFNAGGNDFKAGQVPTSNSLYSIKKGEICIIDRFLGNMNLSPEQQGAMNRMIKKLSTEKKKFDGFLKCLNEIKKNLHKHCSNIENIVDEISYSLNPIQIGKFLLSLEKERNRKEFSVEKLWFGYQIEQDDEKEDGNSTPYSSTYSVSAHNDNIKRASNYNEIPIFNNEEEYQENDSFYIDQVQKKIHK